VDRLFAELLDAPVVVEEMDPSGVPADLSPLRPEEREMMSRAVEKRRREFTAGRVLARRAMRRLGLREGPLVNGEDRAPVWPSGVVGSITHTKGWCAVALARDADLEERLWDTICTPHDLDLLRSFPERDRGWLGKLVFSAKESGYKAQYLLTRQYLGFQAMTIDVDLPSRRFVATFTQQSGDDFLPGDRLEGTWRRRNGLVATAVTIAR